MSNFLGYKWLAGHLDIVAVQPFAVESQLGRSRRTHVAEALRQETYPASAQLQPTIAAHLTFAFKHEIVNLEFLSRLFKCVDAAVFEQWIRNEPTGGYARRTGFFYEWMTGLTLDVPDAPAGNYIDALDPDTYFVATRALNVPRWRIRDNLPGTRQFCPIVIRTEAIRRMESYDCAAALHALEVEFGSDILLRSAVWLTIKESRASFLIEHEERKVERVQRFAAVMESRCGKDPQPFSVETLSSLQAEILGAATRYGIRQSPVFVGHSVNYLDKVDYIAPHWEQTQPLLQGLQDTLVKTQTASPLTRAAIASFGFVFIHPMSDGNGRISRFLVNDILRRDGAVPEPFILPISATITNSTAERAGYDRALERFSRPLMRHYADKYRFGAMTSHADGVESNLHFDAYDDAEPVWRFPDLTGQAEYMGHVIQATIELEMTREAIFLRDIEHARADVKEYLEGPNTDIDHIIRSVRENRWSVSNKLKKTFPQLQDGELADSIVSAIRNVFDPQHDPATDD